MAGSAELPALPAPAPARGQGPEPAVGRDGAETGHGHPNCPTHPEPERGLPGAAPGQVPPFQCQHGGLCRSCRAGNMWETRQQGKAVGSSGVWLLGGHVGCGEAQGPVHGAGCTRNAGDTSAGSREQTQAALGSAPRGCAHREHGLEVVEQLDVLGDAGAGPADHVVLAAGEARAEEPQWGQAPPRQSGSSACPRAPRAAAAAHGETPQRGWRLRPRTGCCSARFTHLASASCPARTPRPSSGPSGDTGLARPGRPRQRDCQPALPAGHAARSVRDVSAHGSCAWGHAAP